MPTDNLVIKRHFKAPPERVFAAFTEKALMQAWFGPGNTTVPRCEVDARVGGKYRAELHAPSGGVHIVTGEFKEIRPPDRLVYTWGWLDGAGRGPETVVTVTFVEYGNVRVAPLTVAAPAASLPAAETVAARDPLHARGIRVARVHRWNRKKDWSALPDRESLRPLEDHTIAPRI